MAQLNFAKLPKTENGFPYAVFHERPMSKAGEGLMMYDTKGGKTIVVIYTMEGQEVARGEAVCHPVKDGFNKRLGRTIALGRALKYLREHPQVVRVSPGGGTEQ